MWFLLLVADSEGVSERPGRTSTGEVLLVPAASRLGLVPARSRPHITPGLDFGCFSWQCRGKFMNFSFSVLRCYLTKWHGKKSLSSCVSVARCIRSPAEQLLRESLAGLCELRSLEIRGQAWIRVTKPIPNGFSLPTSTSRPLLTGVLSSLRARAVGWDHPRGPAALSHP